MIPEPGAARTRTTVSAASRRRRGMGAHSPERLPIAMATWLSGAAGGDRSWRSRRGEG